MIEYLARPPTMTTSAKHAALGIALAAILLTQTLVLDAVAPASTVSDAAPVIEAGAIACAGYAMLPQLRYLSTSALNIVVAKATGGEAA
jgi:hypothetical protein